jgi:hypothetical protein
MCVCECSRNVDSPPAGGVMTSDPPIRYRCRSTSTKAKAAGSDVGDTKSTRAMLTKLGPATATDATCTAVVATCTNKRDEL